MNPEVSRAGLRWAVLILVLAGGLMFFVQPGTPEFVITVFMLGIALLFIVVVVLLSRFLR